MTNDHVIYCDTDSNFYSIESFIKEHVGLKKWDTLGDEQKIAICRRIAGIVTDYVNDIAYNEVQVKDFNSRRKDFKIIFEQEIIARSGLFAKKKHYGLSIVDMAGERKDDEILIKGLSVVKSETPRAVRPMLKNILTMLVHGRPDIEISKAIRKDKKQLLMVDPEEIAKNISVNHMEKYVRNGQPIKGAPGHVRAAHNYNKLIAELGLENKYEIIKGLGNKVKVVSLVPNRHNMEYIGFFRWPVEFEDVGIRVDYNMMIDSFYVKTVENLLEIAGKEHLLSGGSIDSLFS